MLGKLKVLAAMAAVLCGFTSLNASATFLAPGQSLSVNQSLTSHDGRYAAVMQSDGNFVVYRLADGTAVWNAGTTGSGATLAVMQTDGNFVLYTADSKAVWSTGTWQSGPQPNQFTVDDDGTAVVVTYAPVWSTGTGVSGNAPGPNLEFKFGDTFTPGQVYTAANGYQWTFQTDGNLVLYRNGAPAWASNKTGAKYARFEGRLVTWNDAGYVYQSPAAQPPNGLVYQKGSLTLNADASHFVIQSDGNAVIYQAFRMWGSNPPTDTSIPGGYATKILFGSSTGPSASIAADNAVQQISLSCLNSRGRIISVPLTNVYAISPSLYSASAQATCQYPLK